MGSKANKRIYCYQKDLFKGINRGFLTICFGLYVGKLKRIWRFRKTFIMCIKRQKLGSARRSISRVLSLLRSRGWPFILDIRYRISRATYPNGDAETRPKPRGLLPFLFGFAPGGVCHATPVARSAVRSCRTLSPLPVLNRRSTLCGTFPEVSFAGYYPAPCFRGARTFLSFVIFLAQRAATRPSDS